MTTAPSDQLTSIDHIVVLMLENRSFDHMLGYLYTDAGNQSPAGQALDGLTGNESNPDSSGTGVDVYQLQPGGADVYLSPGADPGEGYTATNSQLANDNQGFVTNFASTLTWERADKWSIVAGTQASEIMGMFTPTLLPVLSGLAKGFAVCDQWFASVPTETMPNRAFACAGTSQGVMDDKTKSFTCPSIFGSLTTHSVSWSVYGYTSDPLTRLDFPDTKSAPDSHFGLFTDFQAAAKAGTLASYVFLEPSWESTGNSQHPNYNVALGEQLIYDVYQALRTGPDWNSTLLIVTYDEHGGCYDHVAPPSGATPPDSTAGEFGFDFTRFGLRVPTVLVSPRIEAGTVFRVPAGTTPLDHTSILKTVETRFGVPSLTARDAAAPSVSAALTLTAPRTDDPLQGVAVPQSPAVPPSAEIPSHLQQVHAGLVASLPGNDVPVPANPTTAELKDYIDRRTAAWKAAR